MVYSNSDLLLTVMQALSSTAKAIRDVDIQSLHVSIRSEATHLATQPLNCLELVNSLVHLYDTVVADDIRILVDRLSIQAPELLLMGFAQIQPLQNQLHRDTLLKLLNIFLIGHANSNLVIMLLWRKCPALLMDGFLAMYKKDPSYVSRILDVSQEAKILFHVLNIEVPYFVLDLASLAARRQHLNLEKWLMDNAAKDNFIAGCIDFLEKKYMMEVARQFGANVTSTLQLSVDVVNIILRVVRECAKQPVESAKVAQLVQAYSNIYPQLNETLTHVPKPAPDGDVDSERSYSPEVEETVRRYFERLYTMETSPNRFASLLKTCRNSSDQKQLDFFSCTVHTLLDEARFFDQYPEDELLVTGELLGLLVEHHLISYAQLRVALKYILDAVNNKHDSKMFNFGTQALLQFRDRYSEWPQYTLLLSKIDGLKGYPMIYSSIATALQQIGQREQDQGTPKDNNISTGVKNDSKQDSAGKVSSNGHDLAPDVLSLLEKSDTTATHEQPPTKVQERVSFLINNLSIGNMDTKCPELLKLLEPSTWPWFSHYLVVRRVSIEPNNHDLYMSLLNQLDLSQLNDIIVEDTYSNIRVLLQSDTITSSSADRKLLKNLGIWLGKLTIAKNKPIRHKDLSFKNLLLDAYDRDRLVVAIPLCCQVLHQASNSKVFKPPNPWLMSILKLLAELYWTDKLRLNMKFEIEILFDNLKLDLNEIEPTLLLQKRQEQTQQPQVPQLQPQAQNLQQQQRPAPGLPMATGPPPSLPANASPQKLDQDQRSFGPNINQADERPEVDISPLLSRLQLNPVVSQFISQQPLVKATIFRAISESFADVVPPVILSTSNIASISTKELILKDFATEPDEMKLKRAAYSMVQPLVGNLAVATCKETLCNAMIGNICEDLIQAGLPKPLSDEIASTVVSDNLQLTCLFVEQLAHLRAINDIDRALSMAYANRISHREKHGGAFFDPLSRNSAPRSTPLPEALKPNGSITAEQMFLYESFNRPLYDPLQQAPAPPPGPVVNSPHPPSLPLNQAANTTNALTVKLEQMLLEMDRMIRQTNVTSVASLPPNHDLFLLIRQIPLMISQSSAALPSVMNFVEKVVYMLYESSSAFGREIYVLFLQTLFGISREVTHETLAWLLYADDQRKFNPEVIAALIQHEVIPAEEYDTHLAKMIYNKVDGATGFAIDLMQLCLLTDCPITRLEDHVLTIKALQHSLDENSSQSITDFLDKLKKRTKPLYAEIEGSDSQCMDARLLLAEWIRLNQHPLVTDDITQSLVKKAVLITQDSEKLCFFVRMCTEACVDHYMSQRSPSPSHKRSSVTMIDSYAKLVSCMATADSVARDDNKLKVFGKALSVIVLVLAHHHERLGSEFNQKPFLRLLTSLYAEIHKCMDLNLLVAFSDTLLTLQPFNFPGFAFAWLHLISHRNYLPQLLVTDENKGWTICQRLVLGLLEFLRPLLEQHNLDTATKTFYRGTLRVLVVLLHDFPEFLCHNYFTFSQAIPISSIQMRNLVLSAFPRTMHLPDPFTPNLQLDDLPESKVRPFLDTSYLDVLATSDLVPAVDAFLEKNNSGIETENSGSLKELLAKVTLEINSALMEGQSRGSQVLGAFVLYIGDKASKLPFRDDSLALTIYKYLLSHLTDEGLYLLLGSLADHLRYPNSHTYFFSRAILYLFETENESVKERITRVLLERLIVNRPHPWGLLSLFIDMMKDEGFWKYGFIQCSPEIEQLFSNVSRSIKHAT
ncbi:unnamed protein product [Absidia cylindrospora]